MARKIKVRGGRTPEQRDQALKDMRDNIVMQKPDGPVTGTELREALRRNTSTLGRGEAAAAYRCQAQGCHGFYLVRGLDDTKSGDDFMKGLGWHIDRDFIRATILCGVHKPAAHRQSGPAGYRFTCMSPGCEFFQWFQTHTEQEAIAEARGQGWAIHSMANLCPRHSAS